jgi:hypothetical protein
VNYPRGSRCFSKRDTLAVLDDCRNGLNDNALNRKLFFTRRCRLALGTFVKISEGHPEF